jgi:SAM-dependent MidA family methyltransferase
LTPAAEVLASEIRAHGPVLFSRFMEVALYHPQYGYYRNARDPFGKEGDFYTASQLQPVFGRLLAGAFRHMRTQLGEPPDFSVVEWGAGRGDLAAELSEFRYTAIDRDRGASPSNITGVVFCNELFDALPVDVLRLREQQPVLMRVGVSDGRFVWVEGESPSSEWTDYAGQLAPHFPRERDVYLELPVRLQETLIQMTSPLHHGACLIIDYGYLDRELVRFPQGTLMSYHRHHALDDVLLDPGARDITAHVPFSYLQHCAQTLGLHSEPVQTLAQFILHAGEADQFAAALHAPDEASSLRLRLQLKSLLFGMGETFRCLTLHRRQPQ